MKKFIICLITAFFLISAVAIPTFAGFDYIQYTGSRKAGRKLAKKLRKQYSVVTVTRDGTVKASGYRQKKSKRKASAVVRFNYCNKRRQYAK